MRSAAKQVTQTMQQELQTCKRGRVTGVTALSHMPALLTLHRAGGCGTALLLCCEQMPQSCAAWHCSEELAGSCAGLHTAWRHGY